MGKSFLLHSEEKKLGKEFSIVITGSISGVMIASHRNVLYSTSKSTISGFGKNAALDLTSKNIRVI